MMHQPGIEPRSVPWRDTILPLDHWCWWRFVWSLCYIWYNQPEHNWPISCHRNYSFSRRTFWQIVKKKSTESYKGVPYITTLMSTSLWTFYGVMKPGGLLVATVNGAGAALQFIYVSLYLIYAPKDKKVTLTIQLYFFLLFPRYMFLHLWESLTPTP